MTEEAEKLINQSQEEKDEDKEDVEKRDHEKEDIEALEFFGHGLFACLPAMSDACGITLLLGRFLDRFTTIS